MAMRLKGIRWRWVVALLLSCGFVLWLLLGGREPPPAVSVVAPAHTAQPPVRGASLPAAQPSSAAAATDPQLGGEQGQVEFCGQPIVQFPRSMAELKHFLQQASQSDEEFKARARGTRQRVVERLRGMGGSLDLLAAHVLADDEAPAPTAGPLLRDPISYALRYQLCYDENARLARRSVPSRSDPASCAPFTGAGWAAIEPDNGRAWLAAWMEARNAKDAAAEASAWTRLSLAPRFDQHEGLLGLRVLRAAGDINEMERLGLMVVADALPSGPAMQRLSGDRLLREACKGSAEGDGQRREECRRLARNLSQGGVAVGDKRLALKLAAASGLEASALAFDETSVTAAETWRAAHTPMLSPGESQPFGCTALRQDLARLAERAELGEWAALGKAMQRRP